MQSVVLGGCVFSSVAAEPSLPSKPADLYAGAKVWTAHFRFTPEQWDAMEPKGGGDFFIPRNNQPNQGGFRRSSGFGAATFLAPAIWKNGDANRDNKLTKPEFEKLSEKWFAEWDKEKTGKLNQDQLREGLNKTLASANPGGEGGFNLQGREGGRNGLAAAMGIEFQYVHADLELDGKTLKNVAVRYKGNGTFLESRATPKRSLKVDLNEYDDRQKFAGITKLNFHNNITDASWMNEVMSHRLYRDAGVPAPRAAYGKVYVTVPEKFERKYLGLYSMVENMDGSFLQETFGTKKGALFKPVTPFLFADLGDVWTDYQQTYDPKTELTAKQKQRVIDFCKLVTHADDATFAAKLGDYVDLDEFARYMAVTVWLSTLDSILSIGQNYYLYLDPKKQRFQFMPWDLDHSFGQFPLRGTQEQREQLSIHQPWTGENRFLSRVFAVASFKKLYLAKLGEFSKTIFLPERFHKQVDQIAAAIRPAVLEESAEKLSRLNKAVAGEPVSSVRPSNPWGFGQAQKPIKAFVTIRATAVQEQVTGRSEGQILGEFGFGARRPRGERNRFGPGNFITGSLLSALDADRDGWIVRDEFTRGFTKWFASWNEDKSGALTEDQLNAGLNRDLPTVRGGSGIGTTPAPTRGQ